MGQTLHENIRSMMLNGFKTQSLGNGLSTKEMVRQGSRARKPMGVGNTATILGEGNCSICTNTRRRL